MPGMERLKQSSRGVCGVGCRCSSAYHWACVTRNVLDPVDIILTWYCEGCLRADPSLKLIYQTPPRKSTRASQKHRVNYSDSGQDQDGVFSGDPDRFIHVANSKTNVFDALDSKESGPHKPFRRVAGRELSLDWLLQDPSAMTEPLIIDDPDCLASLGMKMPPRDLSIREISNMVGPNTPVEVIDVASQAELSRWTLGQWATYFESPNRDRVRNVISLEVSETDLGQWIEIPRIVREMDWVQTVWPDQLKQSGRATYPKVQKYCLMSVARCWTDWHVDFAGSSVFYHILRGSKTFYFIRPTVANLAKYERWSGNSQLQESTWLGDQVNVVYKVQLRAGDTMIIPTGWIHAVYTPTDSLVFGGNYCHSLNIPIQLRIHQIENSTKVAKKFRFPFFLATLWFVAHHYTTRLLRSLGPTPLDNQAGPSNLDCVEAHLIPGRILSGLLVLADFLIDQASHPLPEQKECHTPTTTTTTTTTTARTTAATAETMLEEEKKNHEHFGGFQEMLISYMNRFDFHHQQESLPSTFKSVASELRRLVQLELDRRSSSGDQPTKSETCSADLVSSCGGAREDLQTTTVTVPQRKLQIRIKRKCSVAKRNDQVGGVDDQRQLELASPTTTSGHLVKKVKHHCYQPQQTQSQEPLKMTEMPSTGAGPTKGGTGETNKSRSAQQQQQQQSGSKDQGTIVFRSSLAPQTTMEVQARRLPPLFLDDDYPSQQQLHQEQCQEQEKEQGKEKGVWIEGVEIRTTSARNRVVRSYVDELGRTVYETRRVSTVIEKAIYPISNPSLSSTTGTT